jgi:hypothetical protein
MESVCDDAQSATQSLSLSGHNEASASQASAEAHIESVNSDRLSDAMHYASDDVLQCQSSDETKHLAQAQSASDPEAVAAPIVNLESRSVAADESERKGSIRSTSADPDQATSDTQSDSMHGISSFRRESASGSVEADQVGHGEGDTQAVAVTAAAVQVALVEDHAGSDDSNVASLEFASPEFNSKAEGTTGEGDDTQATVVTVAATAQVALVDNHGTSIVSNVSSPACANTEAAAAGAADASPLDDTTFAAEARAASKVLPYSPVPSAPVSPGRAPASFQRLQSRATIFLQLCELLFMVFNTFYATYNLGLIAAQVQLGPTQIPEISNLLSSSADGSFYIVTHSKPLVRDIIQPVNSASSSFFPAVQSGRCSAVCAHMYSQKLYNSLEQSLDVFSNQAYFARGASATSAQASSYDFGLYHLPEPLNAKFIAAQCPIAGSSLKSINFLCDAAIISYPQFIAAIAMWCAYFVVLIASNLVPIVTFKADLNDLRLRVAIESHNNSRLALCVLRIGHLFSLATFGIALSANSEFAQSNDKYLTGVFIFVVNNIITLSSIGSSEFKFSMSASEIKKRWPRPIKCSAPAPSNSDIWASLNNVVCHQSDYFTKLLRSLHPENRNDLQAWGDSEEILDLMTEVMSCEGTGDIPSESKQIPIPMLCQIFIFFMSLLVGYQSFSFVSDAALIYNRRVYPLDQAQYLGVALKRGTAIADLVSNLTKTLPTALPGTSTSAILGSPTATFRGYSTTTCTFITGAPVSTFQMSTGICKPLKDGRSISIEISSAMQGSLNIFSGSSCVGAKSHVVQLNSFLCNADAALVGAIPFEERSYPDLLFFEKEFRSPPVQSLYVTFEGPVPFTDANVSVSLGTVAYAGEIVNLGSMRYGNPGYPFSVYPLAGEQRIAACRLSESLCIPSINDLYLKHRPSSQIIEINFMINTNHGTCAPKPPYHKSGGSGLDFAFYFSEKFASYLTAPSSATVECSSPVAFVPTLDALWALYLAALAFFLFSHAFKYSPTDFRFFIALELGTVISLQYRFKHVGAALAVATAVVSFTSGTADSSIATRASLYIYMFFSGLSALFTLHSSPLFHHRECAPTELCAGGTSGSAGSNGPKNATTSLKEVLQSLTVPIELKLPASQASITNLYGIFVSKTDVFNNVERAALKDVLCNGSSLNTWGDGAAIGQVMKLLVKSS